MKWPWNTWKVYQRIKEGHLEAEADLKLVNDTTLREALHRLGHLSTPVSDTSVEITNLKVRTNIEGAKYVLVIDGNGSPGMQHPIGVDGHVKCIICTERASNRLVCASCEAAIHFVRSLSSKLTSTGLLEFNERLETLDQSGLMDLLNLVTVDFLREWVQAQAKEFNAGPDDAGSEDRDLSLPWNDNQTESPSGLEGGPGG